MFIRREHDVFLCVSTYCSSCVCMFGIGWSYNDTASNGEVCGEVRAWCGVFQNVSTSVGGTEGLLDCCGSCNAVLGVLEELWGVGKKTHSILDCDAPRPMCISSPNLPKWWYISSIPFLRSSLVPNGNEPSSMYRHCSISYEVSFFEANMAGVWLQILPSIKLLLAAVITVRMGISCCFHTISRVSASALWKPKYDSFALKMGTAVHLDVLRCI